VSVTPKAPPPPEGLLALGLFSSLALLPAVAALISSDGPTAQPCSDLALSIALWVFWLALWPKPRHACLVAAPLLIATPLSVYLVLSQHSQLSSAVVAIILETNLEESSQYLRGLWLPLVLSYLALTATAVPVQRSDSGHIRLPLLRSARCTCSSLEKVHGRTDGQ